MDDLHVLRGLDGVGGQGSGVADGPGDHAVCGVLAGPGHAHDLQGRAHLAAVEEEVHARLRGGHVHVGIRGGLILVPLRREQELEALAAELLIGPAALFGLQGLPLHGLAQAVGHMACGHEAQ